MQQWQEAVQGKRVVQHRAARVGRASRGGGRRGPALAGPSCLPSQVPPGPSVPPRSRARHTFWSTMRTEDPWEELHAYRP
jgi:hypothetical protein